MKPLVDSVQFFNNVILAKYSIVSLSADSIYMYTALKMLVHCEMLHKRNFMRTQIPKN